MSYAISNPCDIKFENYLLKNANTVLNKFLSFFSEEITIKEYVILSSMMSMSSETQVHGLSAQVITETGDEARLEVSHMPLRPEHKAWRFALTPYENAGKQNSLPRLVWSYASE
jgi:hypothetical protein